MSNAECSAATIPVGSTGGKMLAAPSSQSSADADLASALAADLNAAFEPFVIAYRDSIVTFVARMLGDDARAEDVAQETFVRAYRALQEYAPERRGALHVRSWIYAIAHNLTRNAVRDAPPRTESLDFADGSERATRALDSHAGPDDLAAQHETWAAVAAAIDRLSPRLRPAYVMRYLDDLSYEEIAHALQQPIGTVKASAHRAAIAVRSILEKNDD